MSDEPSVRAVRGRIALPPELPREQARAVRVAVEDVSRADAPAEVVAAQVLEDVDLEPGGELAFDVEVPAGLVDLRRRYSVSVHVDVSGSGDVTKGDLVSTASYPVLTDLADSEADQGLVVTVRRV